VAGVGFHYDKLEDAVDFIRAETGEEDKESTTSRAGLTPAEIADKARIFGLEAFQSRIKDVIARRTIAQQ
jgi:hypothetical protein